MAPELKRKKGVATVRTTQTPSKLPADQARRRTMASLAPPSAASRTIPPPSALPHAAPSALPNTTKTNEDGEGDEVAPSTTQKHTHKKSVSAKKRVRYTENTEEDTLDGGAVTTGVFEQLIRDKALPAQPFTHAPVVALSDLANSQVNEAPATKVPRPETCESFRKMIDDEKDESALAKPLESRHLHQSLEALCDKINGCSDIDKLIAGGHALTLHYRVQHNSSKAGEKPAASVIVALCVAFTAIAQSTQDRSKLGNASEFRRTFCFSGAHIAIAQFKDSIYKIWQPSVVDVLHKKAFAMLANANKKVGGYFGADGSTVKDGGGLGLYNAEAFRDALLYLLALAKEHRADLIERESINATNLK